MPNNSKDAEGCQSDSPPSLESEHQRTKERRSELGIDRDHSWALALSGGGIRSATFCLGVLQGLAKSPPPPKRTTNDDLPPPDKAIHRLLPQFDYLSTVSGGGYIGSFFCSLFVRNRLNRSASLNDKATAEQAYGVLDKEPPGRLHSKDSFDATEPGALPLAWLRENGRYLAPTGTGDAVYAAALAVRNWFAMHYVLGTVLFTAFALPAGVRALLARCFDDFRDYEVGLLNDVLVGGQLIWWSPIWWLAAPILLLWVIPSGLAYWLSHPAVQRRRNPSNAPSAVERRRNQRTDRHFGTVTQKPLRLSMGARYAWGAGSVVVLLAIVGFYCLNQDDWLWALIKMAVMGTVVLFGCVWYANTAVLSRTISGQRVTLTRALTYGFVCLGGVMLMALIDTTAQSLYAKLYIDAVKLWLTPAAMAGGVAWLVRTLASATSEKAGAGLLSKIPLNVIAMLGGAVLLFLVALLWSLLVLWIHWHGAQPDMTVLVMPDRQSDTVWVLGVAALLAASLALVCGQFPGFLNLSTLQGLYSARLTRAYFGASNGERFAKAKAEVDAQASAIKMRSVAEPLESDHLTSANYYSNPLAPLHIINVCVNQTVDPAEQLVQRDRKGKPLAILPGGFALDGEFSVFLPPDGKSELGAELTMGEWVGVSGAAFSTGLGRSTSLGYSLVMGLANVRLGRWWQSGITRSSAYGLGRLVRTMFKTQAYLFNELLANYYGTRRPLQYLSDGGHFENTGIYELLRKDKDNNKDRNIRLIVACDCGCDPAYEFEDLANLVRLARIDFGIEIEVDCGIAADPILGEVFGVPEDFAAASKDARPVNGKCALLLNVYHSQATQLANKPDCRIVLLKPRLVAGLALDLVQYQATRSAFPQEPTADQFYDEAQWESYRKLGLEIASRVFGTGGYSKNHYQALWKHLLA